MNLEIMDDPLEVTDEECRQIFEMLRLEIVVLTEHEREEAVDRYWGAPNFSTTYNEGLPAFSTGCLTSVTRFFS